jgi:nucleobase transporter 1/2
MASKKTGSHPNGKCEFVTVFFQHTIFKSNEFQETVDSTLSVLLGTSILVGGFLGCLLDHIIPGTPEERGLVKWSKEMSLKGNDSGTGEKSTYDFPYGMEMIKR